MRAAASILAILLLAPVLPAAEEERVFFVGEFETDPEDLERVASGDIARCLAALDRAIEDPASEKEHAKKARIAADDSRFEMVRYLRLQGYPNAEVTPRTEATKLHFAVEEGTIAYPGEVVVDGTSETDPEELAGLLRLPKSWLLGSRLFVEAEYRSTSSKMISYLRQRGYLRAEVDGPAFTPDPAKITGEEAEIAARYVVREGPRAYLRSVDIRGMKRYRRDQIKDDFGDSIEDLIDQPFGPLTPYDLQSIITGFYSSHGHPYAEVSWEEPAITESGSGLEARMVLTVTEGPLTRVKGVRIQGNERTKEEAIRRELDLNAGDRFDSRRVARSRRHLLGTRLFGNVRIEIPGLDELEVTDPLDVEYSVTVEEVDHRRLETSIGFGSWDLLRAGASMTWMNLWGMGRTATIEVDASIRGAGAGVAFSEPWLFPGIFWDRTLARLSLSAEARERPSFSYQRLGAELSLTKREIAHRLDLSFGYRFRFTDVTDVSGDVDEEFQDTTNTGELFGRLVRDARDDPWNPTQGSILSADVSLANAGLGSDLDFLRVRLRAVQIFPIEDRTVLVLCAEAGAVKPYGITDMLPLQERFYLGGGESVRSFGVDDLGPRFVGEDGTVTDTASGGEFFSRLSLELRLPVWGDLEGAAFIDVGNVVERLNDPLFRGYRLGLGLGLRYRTPLGAVRIDAAINPSPRDYESSFGIFFALGYPF